MQPGDTVAGPPQCRAMELQRKRGAQYHISHKYPCAWEGGSGLAGSCCFAFIMGTLGDEQSCSMPADQPAMSGRTLTAAQPPSTLERETRLADHPNRLLAPLLRTNIQWRREQIK